MKKINLENLLIYYFLGLSLIAGLGCVYLIYLNNDLQSDITELKVILEGDPEYLFSIDNTNGTSGNYFLRSHNIALYPRDDSPYLTLIHAHHEISHYIWYEFLSDKLRDDYAVIYENSDEFVSDYAMTEVEEDFAETVSKSIIIDINYSKIPEDRREFVRKWVHNLIVT